MIGVSVPRSGDVLPVSVIIPCYKCAHTIKAAVDSVLCQTALPVEIILVEDCSADGGQTLSALHCIKSESRSAIHFEILSLPENLGPGEARNAGWSVASQEFIAFLDADDTWHRRKLEIQIGWMLDHPEYVLTCHDTRICIGSGLPQLLSHPPREQALGWRSLIFRNHIATRSVVLKRRISQRFPVGVRHAEDYGLWIRILLQGAPAMRLNLPLAFSYKAQFASEGLSGDLRAMHDGVVNCLEALLTDRLIPRWLYLVAIAFELFKYRCRIFVALVR